MAVDQYYLEAEVLEEFDDNHIIQRYVYKFPRRTFFFFFFFFFVCVVVVVVVVSLASLSVSPFGCLLLLLLDAHDGTRPRFTFRCLPPQHPSHANLPPFPFSAQKLDSDDGSIEQARLCGVRSQQAD